MKNIHPLIQKLSISDQSKFYFNRLELYDIIDDPIVLSDETKDIDECLANRWSFKVELEHCNKEDIKIFYQAVIESRKNYLISNKIDLEMIFYTWYDSMSGNFYFSLIPTNWSKLAPGKDLPFGYNLNKVCALDEIIEEFISCPYKGIVPINSLQKVDPNSENDDEEEFMKNYVLNV